MLKLNNVTLVTIDSVADHPSKNNIRLAAISRIVPKLCEKIKFGHVLAINPFGKNKHLIDEPFDTLWQYDFERNPRNIHWYSNFVIKKLPHLISTKWYLIIQWDGFPDLRCCEQSWDDRFFDYPYLGGGHSLYNGGFSLRNTELMQQLSTINDNFGTGAEDGFYSAFLDNTWTKEKNTPFKFKWDEEEIVNKFCAFLKYDQTKPVFGWHRSNFLSEHAIKEIYKFSDCFNENEITKLIQYCSTKIIPTYLANHIFVDDYMKHFDIDYNDEFFKY